MSEDIGAREHQTQEDAYCRMRLNENTVTRNPWHYIKDRKHLLEELDEHEKLDTVGTIELQLL